MFLGRVCALHLHRFIVFTATDSQHHTDIHIACSCMSTLQRKKLKQKFMVDETQSEGQIAHFEEHGEPSLC